MLCCTLTKRAYLQNLVSSSEKRPADLLQDFDSVHLFREERKKKKGPRCILSPLGRRYILALVVVSPEEYPSDRRSWLKTARSHSGDGACSQRKQQSDFSVVFNEQDSRYVTKALSIFWQYYRAMIQQNGLSLSSFSHCIVLIETSF